MIWNKIVLWVDLFLECSFSGEFTVHSGDILLVMWSKLISLKSFNQLNYNCKCNQLTARAQISCFVMLSTRNMCKIVLLNSCLKKKTIIARYKNSLFNIRGLPWTRFYGTVVKGKKEEILPGRICSSIILSIVKLEYVCSFKDNEILCHIICLKIYK